MATKTRVLFVCIHNSARSQMAEAFLNNLCGQTYTAQSAGIEAGQMNPIVIAAMLESGIDLSGNRTKEAAEFIERAEQFDFVVTVCDETSAERCPLFPGGAQRLHWGFPDPSAFQGSDAEKLERTRTVRDAIRARIVDWCGAK